MSKRARYTGNPPGVWVEWPAGEVYVPEENRVFVEPNHLLPDEVPAKVRDELLKGDDFSEVEQSAPTSSAKEDK